MISITVWNEFIHEREKSEVAALYPDGMHNAIADFLNQRMNATGSQINVRTATLDQPEHGLPADVLDSTDVLIWWGIWLTTGFLTR